jgi:hypothetical protein
MAQITKKNKKPSAFSDEIRAEGFAATQISIIKIMNSIISNFEKDVKAPGKILRLF